MRVTFVDGREVHAVPNRHSTSVTSVDDAEIVRLLYLRERRWRIFSTACERSAMMDKSKLELIVGVFVLVGIVCLGYLSIKLGKLELIGGDVYEVDAVFNSATGLKAGAAVEVAGVEVGRVKIINLKEDRAMVRLAVQNGTKLYSDTIASIKTRGIIGEKYLALSPGGGGDPLKPGDTIRDTESGLDLEELVSQYVHGKVN
jgi:phospholipid/cholesterol/gamma-HCH transport system substrate-binding protein